MKNKAKIVVFIELDTEEYHVPADLNLQEQLEDDVLEALEGAMDIKVVSVTVKGLPSEQHQEYQDNN
jgi:hypothetical protein